MTNQNNMPAVEKTELTESIYFKNMIIHAMRHTISEKTPKCPQS